MRPSRPMITRCVHPPDHPCVHPPDHPCESRGLPLVVSIHRSRPFDKASGAVRECGGPVRGEPVEPCEREGGPFDKLRACPVLDTGVNGGIRPVRGEPVEPCEREGARAYIEEGGMDSCSGAGMTVGASSCPRSLSSWKRGAGTQRGEWGGASHAPQGWIPARGQE